MSKKLNDYAKDIQEQILPRLKLYFDLVKIETCQRWIMKIWYCDKTIYESFETYELDPHKLEEAFESKKIRLFLDGVELFYVTNENRMVSICNSEKSYYLIH